MRHCTLRLKTIALCLIAVALVTPPRMARAAANPDPIFQLRERVKRITLKNGMRILVLERPDSPTISFSMFIRTGGMDDESGHTGLAHMFEHMLFKGTTTIGTKDYAAEKPILENMDVVQAEIQTEKDKDHPDENRLKDLQQRVADLEAQEDKILEKQEFFQIYERAGGANINAMTGEDYTNYFLSLPKNQLKLWMVMESDRIKNPVLREFYKERSVIMEERRSRVDASPNGKLWEAFMAAAYIAHPYGRPTVGWESDVERATRADAQRFFKTHYDVSRLVAVIIGGVKTSEVEELARTYFEPIPSHPSELSPLTVEPPQEGERRVHVVFDAEPELIIGYHRPRMLDPDDAVFEIIEQILSSGRISRFNKNIVEKKRIAVSAWTDSSSPGERDPSMFTMGGTPRAPYTAEFLEKALYEEVEKLKTEGPTPEELERSKNAIEGSLVRQMGDSSGFAFQLGYYESVSGNWENLLHTLGDIRNVKAEDVKRVLEKYFVPSNRTVAVLEKKK